MTLDEARAAYRSWPIDLQAEIKKLAAGDPFWNAADWQRLAEFVTRAQSFALALQMIREYRKNAAEAAVLTKK